MYISCTSLLILLFIKSTVYCSAHFILLHIVFFLFYLYLCILSCVVLHILHCPLSGPDLIYISQLIIFCIIEYVMNKTLNLWRRWQNWRSWQIWRWWRKPKFVIFLTIKYIESTNYCIKTNTTNSDYVIVSKAFMQESHLSILIYYWNTKSDGVDKFGISFTKQMSFTEFIK